MSRLWLWAICAAFILYATTLPFQFEPTTDAVVEKLSQISLNPFKDPDGSRPSIPDLVQNVLLFVPFGALGMLTALRQRGAIKKFAGSLPSAKPHSLARALMLVTSLGSAFSAFIELLQLFTVDRISSLTDIVTNTTGSALGALVVIVFQAAIPMMAHDRLRPAATSNAFRMSAIALGLLVIAAWHPFDFSLDVGRVVPKVREFVRDSWQVGAIGDQGVDFLRYALFGGAAAMWLRELGWRTPQMSAAFASAMAAVALELSQFIVGSRMPGGQDILVGVMGGCAGAFIGPRLHTVPPRTSLVVVMTAWLATALMTLAPFTFTAERSPVGLVPFLTYYQYTSSQTVSHVLELMLAFFPIGFALSCGRQRSSAWRVLAYAIVLAGSLEYLQGWIVDRYPDVTDVMMMTLGALIGASVAQASILRAPQASLLPD